MRTALGIFFTIVLVLTGALFLTGARYSEEILRLSSRTQVSLSGITEDLKSSRLIFVGELHDDPNHHRMELDIIRALKNAGVPLAIGMEMFQADYQEDLDRWIDGKIGIEKFISIYRENWDLPWPLYRDIFLYARGNRIPIIGLNVDPQIVAKVAREGFQSLSPEQMKKIPGVTCNVDPDYEKFIRRAMGVHGGDVGTFRHFCEAQIVWDSVMAENLVRFLKKNPDLTVVVLAGGGHSWKYGIPEQVRRRADYKFRVILPEQPDRTERMNVTNSEADYLWLGI